MFSFFPEEKTQESWLPVHFSKALVEMEAGRRSGGLFELGIMAGVDTPPPQVQHVAFTEAMETRPAHQSSWSGRSRSSHGMDGAKYRAS